MFSGCISLEFLFSRSIVGPSARELLGIYLPLFASVLVGRVSLLIAGGFSGCGGGELLDRWMMILFISLFGKVVSDGEDAVKREDDDGKKGLALSLIHI